MICMVLFLFVGLFYTCLLYTSYWQGTPYLDGVNFKIYASTATQQAALEVGDLDIMNLTGDAITADALKAKGYSMSNAAIPSTGYTLCFNSQADGPLKDLRVRQAIAYAVDAKAICDSLLGDGAYGCLLYTSRCV